MGESGASRPARLDVWQVMVSTKLDNDLEVSTNLGLCRYHSNSCRQHFGPECASEHQVGAACFKCYSGLDLKFAKEALG